MSKIAVVDSVTRKPSIASSRKASLVHSVTVDGGRFDVRYVKSGSFDSGNSRERSVVSVSVVEGSVNTGFIEGDSDESVSGDCGLPRADTFLDEQLDKSKKSDNISVMVNGRLEEQKGGCPFPSQRTEGEENISAEQHDEDKIQTSPERKTIPDISKKSNTAKFLMRDYLMAVSLFLITFITVGNMASLSVLAVEWLKEFPNSKSLILYVPNLDAAMMSATGVIDGILINRFSIYKIILLGSFLQTTCIIGSSFSTDAITLVIVLGCVLGTISCLCFLNSFILMGPQFGDAGKSFIAALSLASPCARLLFSNLIRAFIEYYTWRGAMVVLAGINLQMIPLALFLLLSHEGKKKHLDVDSRTKKAADSVTLPESKKNFDVSVLKDPLYITYLITVSFTLNGAILMYSMLPAFLHTKGLEMKETAALYSIYGIVAAVPRISIGLIQRWFNIRFIHIFIALASFMGLMIILINLAESFSAIFASCILLSLTMGGPSGLYNLGVLECLGPNKYSIGASITETSYGLSAGIFGYLASLLIEYMNSYQHTFCIYGALIMTANICLLITTIVQHKRDKMAF